MRPYNYSPGRTVRINVPEILPPSLRPTRADDQWPVDSRVIITADEWERCPTPASRRALIDAKVRQVHLSLVDYLHERHGPVRDDSDPNPVDSGVGGPPA